MAQFTSDPVRTRQRIAELDEYMARSVYGRNGFVCDSAARCRRAAADKGADFYEGQLSHVGLHYDLFDDGVPLRVLVLGMEMGRPDRTGVFRLRRGAFGRTRRLGCGSALGTRTCSVRRVRCVSHSVGLGDDRAGELLPLSNDPVPQHVMQCYALVDKRLCSAVRAGESAKGRRFQASGVPAMDRACLPHLAVTVRILEPTLVILQTKSLRSRIGSHLKHVELIDPDIPDLEYAEFAGVPTVIANFSHPAAQAPYNWGQLAPEQVRDGRRGADALGGSRVRPGVDGQRTWLPLSLPTVFVLLTLPSWVSPGPTMSVSSTPLTCSRRRSTCCSTVSWTAPSGRPPLIPRSSCATTARRGC